MASGDAETIWNAIFSLVRKKSSLRLSKYRSSRSSLPSLDEASSDLAQELFLRLIATDRLSYFVTNNWTSEAIESDLILNELTPILMSRMNRLTGEDPATGTEDSHVSPSARENPALPLATATKLA